MESAKEYLNEIKRLDAVIDAKLAERDTLFEKLTHITPVLKQDVVSTGGFQQDKIGNAISKIADLDAEIDYKIDCLVNLKREASALLEIVSKINLKHYKVLIKKYIEDKTWVQIATEMEYTDVEGAKKLHGRALQTFTAVYQKHKKIEPKPGE